MDFCSDLLHGKQRHLLESTLTNGTAWSTLVVNGLLLLVTAGLAFPWVFMRTMRMYMHHIIIPDQFDYNNLSQSEEDYRNATGDELTDMMDLDFDF